MTWQAIHPSVLVQADPGATRFWYRDDDALHPGDLDLWVDARGTVVRFQLAYKPLINGPVLFVSWETGAALRSGELEALSRNERGYARSPIVRYRRLDTEELRRLRDYVATNGDALASDVRAAVLAALERRKE